MTSSNPESTETERCAVHPEARSRLTCPYCGSYACGECVVRTPWAQLVCRACKVARRGVYPIPWDEGRQLLQTVRVAARTPKMFFGSFPLDATRSLGRPFALACLGAAVMSGAVFIGISPFARVLQGGAGVKLVALLALLMWGPSFGLVSGAVAGVVAANLSTAFGRELPVRVALRACFYARGAWLVAAPLLLLTIVPFLNVLIVTLGFAIHLAYELNVLRWLARRAGLAPARAWVVALLSTTTAFVAGAITLTVGRLFIAFWVGVFSAIGE